jgi:hypothetical protein
VEKQAKCSSQVRSIHWCAGKLLLVRGSIEVKEAQTKSGEWRRIEGEDPPQGALVRRTKGMELWIVDPATLKSLRGYFVPGNQISCAANSPRLLAIHGFTSIERIDLVDLKAGAILDSIPRAESTNDSNSGEGSRSQIDFGEVAILPDGDAALALGNKLYRIQLSNGQFEVVAESPELQVERRAGDFSTPNLYISTDGKFVAFRHAQSGRALHLGPGYIVFPSNEIGTPIGGVVAKDNNESMFAMDVDRKLAFVGSLYPNQLRVFEGKDVKMYNDMPPEMARIASIPGHDSIFLFGKDGITLLTLPGKSDDWSFASSSNKLRTRPAKLRGEAPKQPLAFVANPERKGALMLDSHDFDAAAFSGDGEWLYAVNANEHASTIHAFDTQTWQERRRVEVPELPLYSLDVTLAGPVIYREKTCDLLDAKTLNATQTIELDSFSRFTSPGSNNMLVVNDHNDIQIYDLKSGELKNEILHEQIVEWDNTSGQNSERPSGMSVTWSQDGNVLAIVSRNLHFVRVSGGKPEYICNAGASSGNTMLSPRGKYAAYRGTSGELKIFDPPNVANAVGKIRSIDERFVIDDQGRQYARTAENGPLTIQDLAGNEVYRDPKEGVSDGFNYVLLHPTRPNLFVTDLGGKIQIIQLDK